MPLVGSGSFSSEDKKEMGGSGRQEIESLAMFERAPAALLLGGSTGCSASLKSMARSSVLSLARAFGFWAILVQAVTRGFSREGTFCHSSGW